MRRGPLLPLALSLALAAGCFTLSVPPPEIHDYQIEYAPPEVPGIQVPVVVRLAPFAVTAAYNREAIVYRKNTQETGSYFYHRWMANPADMIGDRLARDLVASGLYSAVQQGATPMPADYDLDGTLEEIEEQITKESCIARLQLRVLLARTIGWRENRPILQKTYSADAPCQGNRADDFVAAMSHAVSEISNRLQRDIYAAIVNDRLQHPAAQPRN